MGKKVYIKYKEGHFDFTEDSRNAPSWSGFSVGIKVGEKVKWVAHKSDIDVDFDGFTIEYKSTPPGSAPGYSSSPSPAGNVHAVESDPAPELGIFKYSVTLNPGNQSIDPEVRVEDPIDGQSSETMYLTKSATPGKLDCESVTVRGLDLLRIALDEDGQFFKTPQEDLQVSFQGLTPFWESAIKPEGFRYTRGTNTTFYYQIQPVQKETRFTCMVSIHSLKLTGEGIITVLPLPEQKKQNR